MPLGEEGKDVVTEFAKKPIEIVLVLDDGLHTLYLSGIRDRHHLPGVQVWLLTSHIPPCSHG